MFIISIISIFALTGATWLVNKILPFRICPICAGVSGTWAWMLMIRFLGYQIDAVILAILLGGSVVGIAYQIEKVILSRTLLWKILFIPLGFITAYSLLSSWWLVFSVTLLVLALFTLVFLNQFGKLKIKSRSQKETKAVKELEKKMEKCC